MCAHEGHLQARRSGSSCLDRETCQGFSLIFLGIPFPYSSNCGKSTAQRVVNGSAGGSAVWLKQHVRRLLDRGQAGACRVPPYLICQTSVGDAPARRYLGGGGSPPPTLPVLLGCSDRASGALRGLLRRFAAWVAR